MNSAFRQQPPFPLKKQAQALASKGRFGDTELVHMNPLEVDVLRSMTPNNRLTINPDTGQPEAFLPLLLALGGGVLGAGAAAAGGTGLLATLGATGAAAIGSGLGTAIETGSLEEGLKAGLISGVLGGIGGKVFGGASSTLGSTGQQVGQEVGKQTAAEIAQTVGAENLITSTLPSAVPTSVDFAGQLAAEQAAKQAATDAATQELAKEAAKDVTLRQAFAAGIPQITNPEVFGSIAASGLTGQGMTEQFNLMNAPLMEEEEEDDFYVPVRLNDRGVRRRPRNLSGTGEFDYFANPFSFTPLRGFEEGGKVDLEPRGMFRGGRAAIEAREGSGVENVGFNPDTFDPFEGQFAPSDFIIPSYFSNPFGSPTTDASGGLDRGLTDAQGNRQFNIVEDTQTQQIFTPRADDTQIALGARGFADAPVIDYNRRLLGDPTRTITTQSLVENPDFSFGTGGTGGTTGGTTTGGGTTGSGTRPQTGTTQIVTGGSPFNETFGMGEGVVSNINTGQQDPYGIDGGFTPVGGILEGVPGAYDPESGFMLPTGPDGRPPMEEGTFGPNDGLAGVGIDAPPAIMGGPDFEAAIDDYLAGVDFSTFVDAPPAMDTSQFLTAADLADLAPDTSQFVTAADLEGFRPDTSQFVTVDDLAGFRPDTSQFLTAADLPTFDPVDTSQFLTAADLPTFDPVDTSQFLTAADLPTIDTSQFLTAADLPTMDTSQFLTAADLPTLDTSQFLTAADLPTLDTSQFLTAADLPTMDTSQFLTAADLPTAFDPTGLQEQIDTLAAAQAPAFDPTGLQEQIASLSAQVAALNPAASAPVFSPTQPVMDFAIPSPRFAR